LSDELELELELEAPVVNMEPNPILSRVRLLELVVGAVGGATTAILSFVTGGVTVLPANSVSRLFKYSGKLPLLLISYWSRR
jgi:hypothetical protein